MRLFGYGRVSTQSQSLENQLATLSKHGVSDDRMFSDKATGKNLDREGLDLLRIKVEKGDKILVTRLDRLGRDTIDMLSLVKEFSDIGVYIHFVSEGYDTSTPNGQMFVGISASIAQAERTRILERTNEGRELAQSKGVKFGRKASIDRAHFAALIEAGTGATAIAKEMKISRSAVYKLKAELINHVEVC